MSPRHLPKPNALKVAAIDLGTNSCHLVITELSRHGHLVILDSHKDTIRLGQALNAKNVLSQESIKRTVKTLSIMKQLADTYRAEIRAVATHATRTAENHTQLLQAVQEETGIELEIIDGPEEARLSFLGMRAGLPIDRHYTLGVDIGGGSTEIIIAKCNDIRFVTSLKLGTVMLMKNFLTTSTPSASDIRELQAHIATTLATLEREISGFRFSQAVATSGTAKAIAAIHHQLFGRGTLPELNGYRLTHEDLVKIEAELIRLGTPSRIKERFNLDQKRSEIILPGTKILSNISRILNVEQWTVCTYGLREGLALDTYARMHLLPEEKFFDVRWDSILTLAQKLGIDEDYALQVKALALDIYDQIASSSMPRLNADMIEYYREILAAAAFLTEAGKFLSYSQYHKHTQYIISNSSIMGFSDVEKALIGFVARYSRKKLASTDQAKNTEYLADHLRIVNFLASCLRLAKALNRTRIGRIDLLSFRLKDNTWHLTIRYHGPDYPDAEVTILESELSLLEKGFGKSLEYVVRRHKD